MAEPQIIIERSGPFGAGFYVLVEGDIGHPWPEYPLFVADKSTAAEARERAEIVRAAHGWAIVDRSGEPA